MENKKDQLRQKKRKDGEGWGWGCCWGLGKGLEMGGQPLERRKKRRGGGGLHPSKIINGRETFVEAECGVESFVHWSRIMGCRRLSTNDKGDT